MQKNPIASTKVALITGAARRIGAEIVRMLHDSGLNIVLHYHTSVTDAEKLSAELNALRPGSVMTLQADLLETSRLADLIEQAVKPWGRLDVVVNNASCFYRTLWGQVTESAWDELLGSNLKAPFFLAQAAAPYLASVHGCIVNIADIHGERPMRDYSAYCIAKAGLIMSTKVLAKELGPAVRVNAVSPGPVLDPEGENVLSAQAKQKIRERTVLDRVDNAREVAKAVLFLIRDADYMTGQVLAVDGGRLLTV
jgi:pteridine reductase